jgi:hypothetical protein
MTSTTFLAGRKPRSVAITTPGFESPQLHLGKGQAPQLEVLSVNAPVDRSPAQIRSLWKARHGGRPAPVLVAVVHDAARVSLCGPVGIKDDPPVYLHLDRGQAERVCAQALDQPTKEAPHSGFFATRCRRCSRRCRASATKGSSPLTI